MKRTLVSVIFVLKIFFLQAQQVSLVAPANQLVTEDTVVQFVWNKSQDAQSYQIQISTAPAFTSFVANQSGITGQRYSFAFNHNRSKYYWRVRSFNGIVFDSWSGIWSLDIFSPASLDSLALWLRADSGLILSGPNLTQWKDQSGNGNDASQGTSFSRPVLDTTYLKNSNTFTFDGVNDFLNFPTISLNPSYTLLLLQRSSGDVMLMGNAAQNYQIRMGYPGNNLAVYNGTMTSSSIFMSPRDHFSFLGMTNNLGTLKFYQNGIQYGSGNFGGFELNTIAQSISLGFLSGSISEVYVLSDAIPDADLTILNKYIFDKYSPPVCLGPDTTIQYGFCPIVLDAKTYFHSYLWNTGETTHSISTNLPGIYSVMVTDEFGRTSVDSINISRPSVSLSNGSICVFDSLIIQPGLSNSYSFLWSTGSTDSLLVVSNPGTYWVEITDSTALHCTIRDTIVVAADSFPVTASLGPDRTFCSGEHIGLIDGGIEATLYSWSTGSSSNAIIISNPGQYSLTVTDSNGCVARDTIEIDIKGVKPKVGFLSSSPCLGNSMSFTDTTVTILPDLPHQWQWAFGDGDLATIQNPTHIYTNAGYHNVNLQVVSDSGCISDTTLLVYVLHLPVANFNPTNGCDNAPLLFHDTSSTVDGTVSSWAWNFGNGNASTIQNPVDTFSTVGTYNVQLIIQTNFGCKDTITKTITIRERPNASFIHNEPCQGTSMNFSDYSTSQNYYPIVSWKWNFGDGGVDSIENPVHTYTLPGIYQAALTVKSLSGCTSTYAHPVELHAFPQPYYNVSWPCAGSPVLFADSSYVSGVSNDSVISWVWSFGSHGVFNSSSPLVLFDTAGVYSFTLTVNSNAACSKSMTDFITVFPSPVSDFTFSPEYGTAPLDIAFTSSAIGANTYVWNFGDGSTSSLQNPQHNYLVNGDYNVVFIATNGYNCSDTSHNLVQVMNPNVDMAALSASAHLDGNYLVVNGVFRNYGNRAVKKADLFLDVPGFPPVREEWTGNLQPGVSMNYSFKTQMFSLKVPSYLCVSVKNPDGITDLHPLNDMACYSQTDSLFVSEPFPNPASGDIALAVVTPFSDDLAVAVYDAVGKLVISQTITSVEGVNNLHLNTATLSIGLYTIRVQYRGLKEVRKFVRN